MHPSNSPSHCEEQSSQRGIQGDLTMRDPKAWVRQWIAIMMAIGLISCAAIEMLTAVSIPTWFLMIASGCITWFFGSREIEKWK